MSKSKKGQIGQNGLVRGGERGSKSISELEREKGRGDGRKTGNLGKKERDQRFWKKEEAIVEAFLGNREIGSAKELAETANVARSTFYKHHSGFHQMMPSIEERTLDDYREEVVKTGFEQGVKMRILFLRTLAFVKRKRREFREIVERGDERTLEKMIIELLPGVERDYQIPAVYREVLRIYEKEIVAVIETWVLSDFSTREMRVLRDIMYLTRTARKRLLPIGR